MAQTHWNLLKKNITFGYIQLSSLLILSFVVPFGAHLICYRIPGLKADQKAICQRKPQTLPIIVNGLRMASKECQQQFHDQRWNCTSLNGHNIFTHHMFRGTRETSFSYAIRSAGVTFAITEACSRGVISFCSCHQIDKNIVNETWQWSGCSSYVNHGIKTAKTFMDSEDRIKRNLRSLMNLHNNSVGRKSVKELLVSHCKCHGVSGSCTARTCWKTLSSFTTIGDYLMKKYKSAKRVELHITGKRSSKKGVFLKLRQISSNERQWQSLPESRALVYFEKSVNYCNKSLLYDSLGTSGRVCDKWSNGSDSCHSICCGRGYNTHKLVVKWKCRCIFHFCCRVECQDCSQKTDQYFCK